jgi:hypothetical protein
VSFANFEAAQSASPPVKRLRSSKGIIYLFGGVS